MRVTSRARVPLTFAVALFFGVLVAPTLFNPTANARAGVACEPQERHAGRAKPPRPRPRASGSGTRVAVQPFDGGQGQNADAATSLRNLRSLIVRIVRGRGFRPMTSLPRYEGTGQYPSLARDHHLAAFVTADLEERGRWQRVTFLIWNGMTGSIVGRWTASAPTPALAGTVGKGFWAHLGPAIARAEAPPLPPGMDRAPPMRIDASDAMPMQSQLQSDDDQVAARE